MSLSVFDAGLCAFLFSLHTKSIIVPSYIEVEPLVKFENYFT